MAAVCDIGELENEIMECLKSGLPVYGFFKGRLMWSCFFFDKIDISKSGLIPEPDIEKDTLCVYNLRKSYVAPDVKNLESDMLEVALSTVYQNVIDIFSDEKCDGIVWNNSVYVCKREKVTGIPQGIAIGIGLGIIYGMLFDNLALGISLGFCFGISFSMIFGTSTHKYTEYGMTDLTGKQKEDGDVDE